MDNWDNQPTPAAETKEQMAAAAASASEDEVVKVNDPNLRQTIIEGFVICPKCQTRNLIRSQGVGDHLICENCKSEIEVSDGNITHSGKATKDPARPATGTLNLKEIGKYPIERFIAVGGMGEVYLGKHPNLRIPVAIKVLTTAVLSKSPEMRERFLLEAQTAARMNHSNIVRVYDADCQGDLFYIVMEFIDGGDVLQAAKKAGGRLSAPRALEVITEVAEALKEAAKYKIVHRDIKPENIMLTKEGVAKLADLGIAKSADIEREKGGWSTVTNSVLGTPGYIAPEQAMNAREVDARSDIYSLGATFFHLVTGSLPFKAPSPFQMMYKHVKEPLPDLKALNPDLPENVILIIKKMMEKAPEDRYQSAEELLLDLRRARDPGVVVGAVAHAAATQAVTPPPQPKSKVVPLALAAAAVLAIVAVAAVVMKNRGHQGNGGDGHLPPVVLTSNTLPGSNDTPGGGKTAEELEAERAAAAAAAKQAEMVSKVKADVSKALQGGEIDVATLLVDGLERAYPQEPAVVDLRLDLLKSRERQAATPLKTAAEQALERLNGLKLDPGQGFGDRIAAVGARLAKGRGQFDEGSFKDATEAFKVVSKDCETLVALDGKRQSAAPTLTGLRAARAKVEALGVAQETDLADQWKQADTANKQAEDAFAGGKFDEVDAPAKAAQDLYGALREGIAKASQRNVARDQYTAALKAANVADLQALAPAAYAQCEAERKQAEAAGKDFAVAADHYHKATALLQQAVQVAAVEATKRKSDNLRKTHDDALATATQMYAKAQDLTRQGGDPKEAQGAANDALAKLAPALAADVQAQVADSPAPKLAAEIKDFVRRAFSKPVFGEPWQIPVLDLETVFVTGGDFTMGSTKGTEQEQPPHQVTISKPFWIGKCEVTQSQYLAMINTNPSANKKFTSPVDSVSWVEAVSFCVLLTEQERKAGRLPEGYVYRLPTEAEWEYACRGGTTTEYSFGDDPAQLQKYGNYCDVTCTLPVPWRDSKHKDGFAVTAPVGSFSPNKLGLYDMHGNVAEWCADWIDLYNKSTVTDPVGPEKSQKKVVRGGSWRAGDTDCRSAARGYDNADAHFNGYGFRVVLGTIPDMPDAKRKAIFGF